jgi:hypothetical protein
MSDGADNGKLFIGNGAPTRKRGDLKDIRLSAPTGRPRFRVSILVPTSFDLVVTA